MAPYGLPVRPSPLSKGAASAARSEVRLTALSRLLTAVLPRAVLPAEGVFSGGAGVPFALPGRTGISLLREPTEPK